VHAHEAILLDSVDNAVFWAGVFHHPFIVLGVSDVYLTPGSTILSHVLNCRVSDYVLPGGPTVHGLNDNQIVVYRVEPRRLKAITTQYSGTTAQGRAWSRPPDAGNPLMAHLLGPEWYALDSGSR
jgi:hypothetical protein